MNIKLIENYEISENQLIKPISQIESKRAPPSLSLNKNSSMRRLKAQDATAQAIRQAAESQAQEPQSRLVFSIQYFDEGKKFKMIVEDAVYSGHEFEATSSDTDFSALPNKFDRIQIVQEWVDANQTDRSWFQIRNLTTGKISLFSGKSLAPKLELTGPDVLKISDVKLIDGEKRRANFYINGLRMNIEIPSDKMQNYYDDMPLIYTNAFSREESADGKLYRIHADFYHPIEKKTVSLASDWYLTADTLTVAEARVENIEWKYHRPSESMYINSWDVKVLLQNGAEFTYRAENKNTSLNNPAKIRLDLAPGDPLEILSDRQNGTSWNYTVKHLTTNRQYSLNGPLIWLNANAMDRWR